MTEPFPSAGDVVHLVGVGGAGMSALARVLLDRGATVSGSDVDAAVDLGPWLVGCEVHRGGHDVRFLPPNATLLIRSSAVPDSNPEVAAAASRGVPTATYAEALGRLTAERPAIAIAGTHGKTTTSSLVAFGLAHAGRDPSFVVGGVVPGLGGGRFSTAGALVVEACEYKEAFAGLRARVRVVTNVEPDHLDHFGDAAAVEAAFRRFVAAPAELRVVTRAAAACLGSIPDPAVVVSLDARREDGGDPGAELRGETVAVERGLRRIRASGVLQLGPFTCPVPGRHFAEDALVAAACLHAEGLSSAEIARGIEAFPGVGRRFERLADGPIALLSDYAHHPTELDAVRSAAREAYPGRRLIAVFQPHQVRRTRDFLERFAGSLAAFDRVWLADIYTAREDDGAAVAVRDDLVRAIQRRGGVVATVSSPERDLVREVLARRREGDVILLLGAGSIDRCRHELRASLSST